MEVGVRARLGLVTACVLGLATTAFAQAPTITARTPSRGSTSGGATVEVLVNGWLVTGGAPTTVTVGGAGGPVTNLVVQPPNRLTFVTPARPAGPVTIIVASGANKATTSFTYVAPVARSISGARRPIFSYTGRFVAFESDQLDAESRGTSDRTRKILVVFVVLVVLIVLIVDRSSSFDSGADLLRERLLAPKRDLFNL